MRKMVISHQNKWVVMADLTEEYGGSANKDTLGALFFHLELAKELAAQFAL